jgi:hypothetical protein
MNPSFPGQLSKVKSPVFTILYGGGSDSCNINPLANGYSNLRYLSQYTHGLVMKTTTSGDDISNAALALAQAFYNNNLLGANDFPDSCQYAPDTQLFFVDESVKSVTVAAVGGSGIRLRLIDTNEQRIYSKTNVTMGDLQLDVFDTLTKGEKYLFNESIRG